ncbi:MAG TPA: hypothetical protein VF950_20645 [Planctomycetota bacterium]
MLLLLALQLDPDLEALRAVGPEGAGHEAAAAAWKKVVERGALLPVLAAFDGASPRAANWLRAAADALPSPDPKALEAFVLDVRRHPEARYLAFLRIDGRDRLLSLDDPGRELRRAAVARALAGAKTLEDFTKLLGHARERDQVDAIAKKMKELGGKADLLAHGGFLTRWQLFCPFDNKDTKGFGVAYPPERGERKEPKDVETSDPAGKVDLNAALGKQKGVVAYAFAAVDSPTERDVELRVATNNAVKLFLNGELLAFRDEYHHGMKIDQYVGRARLKKGRNEVLLKICQNDQKEDWAQSWSFQARLCDALGGGVPFEALK